ncbi:cysteine hydrolase family protein [Cellulomonas persica]|uniref:Isochorismatase n=1 Tax=Cellulomonas persica TaxID=76861 RepID=A0A510UVQ1_9CELL|nr:cysteine hydrolase family protein [Cellulomonas persica]GEK18649.1 isochorismatase [Cellulomonas persica]
MTTLQGRAATALLVIDMQNGVANALHARDQVVATIDGLVTRARAQGTPVVWVRHQSDELPEGSDTWQLIPELRPAADEAIVDKRYGDSFEDTPLESELASRGVGRLVVTGAQTDACVRATLHGGFVRGYDVTLVSDAHSTEDLTEWGAPPPELVVSHANLYWQFQDGPGRTATVESSDEVDLAGV